MKTTVVVLLTSASNGCSAIHYHLLLQKNNKKSFTAINSFNALGDPRRFPDEKLIRSRIASCGCGCFTIYEHKWNGDSLELKKTSNVSFRGTKIPTAFKIYSSGNLIKKYEKKISPKQQDSLFENYVY
ncbi:hypothetical protein [Emticicia sp. BO119]|uniref:hypothetical protein n=1 Tax=Emticicia sp. BO119 TaxID=2757768 RepID=UPI0015F00A5D|nr:hypothetical protein [Emticicia sp. BO119]MBA4849056.1 hypothetical protein [Emticicia sp. BO119]